MISNQRMISNHIQ